MDKLAVAKACAKKMFDDDAASTELKMTFNIPEPGIAVVRMHVSAIMANGFDICHGGYVFTVADSAFALACNAYNDITVAAGASIDFLKPALLGDELIATAREVRRGRRAGLYDVDVRNQDDTLIAVFRGRSASLDRPLIDS